MEMILAFAVTLLAVILGFLSTKRLLVVYGVGNLIDIFTPKTKEVAKMDSSDSTEETLGLDRASNTNTKSLGEYQKDRKDHAELNEMDGHNGFAMSAEDAQLLSPADSDGKPVKVKEFIRMLRANQEHDMTEEEMEEERRIQKQQLQEIFQLMQSSQDQYGIDSIDDMEEQMKLYSIGQ